MASGLKVPIKWKFFALLLALIMFAMLFIILRTNSIFRQDKESFVRELNAKLASSTSRNFLNRIATLQDKLVIFISSRESLSHTGAKVDDQLQVLFSRYQEFLSVGFLSTAPNGALKADWVMRNPLGASAKWPKDYEQSFLTTLNTKAAAANGRGFWRAQSPDGSWVAVLGFSVQVFDVVRGKNTGNKKTAWIVGVLPSGAFDDLLGDFSTGLTTGFVVDDQGYAVASSDNSIHWKSVKDYPVVAEVLTNTKPAGTGDYNDIGGRGVVGSFETIPKTNLTAVVTTPRDKAFEAADDMARNIIFIGVVIMFLAAGAAIIFSNYITSPLQKLAAIAAQIGAGNFKVPVDVTTNDEIGELASSFAKMEQGLVERDEALASAQTALIQGEKMSAFGQLSAGIAHEVKNPLAGILGHAQLAMGKAQSDDIKKHLEVIEKETRRCKTIVENLMKFARQEKAELKATDLAQVAQDTINLVDHQLSLAGCKIYKDFRAAPMVDANANQLQQVLLNLMVNASHAMESCETKNVTVRVLQVGNKAQIQIEDTGTGIPPEVQKKMFEPFFTTKPAGKGTGLGLSVSIGIVKDHKGEIYVKSEVGKGTTFYIDVPIPEGAKVSDRALENTHGGIAVSADKASVPIVAGIPSSPQAPAASLSASGSGSGTQTDITATSAPASSAGSGSASGSGAFPAAPSHGPDVTHIFAGVREEQAKLRELKSTSQMTGVEYKSENKSKKSKKSGGQNDASEKPSDKDTTLLGKTPLDEKTSVTLPGLPDEVIFGDPNLTNTAPAPAPAMASAAVSAEATTVIGANGGTGSNAGAGSNANAAGSAHETATGAPAVVDLPQVTQITEVTAITKVTSTGPAEAVAAKDKAADAGEFKVKIKRPKLKV